MKHKNFQKIVHLSVVMMLFILISLIIYQADLSSNKHMVSKGKDGSDETFGIKAPKTSDYLSFSSLVIDDSGGPGNGTWASINSTYDWCNGKGTIAEPYIIENITINAGGTGSGITINNSQSVFFIIRNCTVYNTGSGASNAGITLDHTNNGIITLNNIHDNTRGIYLDSYCEDNIISNNTLDDNYYGIELYSNDINNSICNNTILGSNEGIGIHYQSRDNYIYNNVINETTGSNGIYLDNVNDNEVVENKIYNYDYGIRPSYSERIIISGNQMIKCGVFLFSNYLSDLNSQIIHTNNTVNGKPVYYYVDKNNLDAMNFSNAGQIILVNCQDSIVNNLNLSDTSTGLGLYSCDNITVSNCSMSYNTYGTYLGISSANITIFNNTLINSYYGLYLLSSNEHNIIENNTISYNNRGISLNFYCNYNNITNNTLRFNAFGISLTGHSNNNTIIENFISNSTSRGIHVANSNNNS
ncbi:MAG: nitrous oxide reductase family maturation protein NosD, partial [Candidatus Odinarchaeota archaeon]